MTENDIEHKATAFRARRQEAAGKEVLCPSTARPRTPCLVARPSANDSELDGELGRRTRGEHPYDLSETAGRAGCYLLLQVSDRLS